MKISKKILSPKRGTEKKYRVRAIALLTPSILERCSGEYYNLGENIRHT